jgi:acetyl-CoA carboxylase biotin carboxylase subunit
MSRALDEFIIRGIKTTIPLHKIIMKDPNFRRGRYSTAFVERLMASTQPIVDEKAKDKPAPAAQAA